MNQTPIHLPASVPATKRNQTLIRKLKPNFYFRMKLFKLAFLFVRPCVLYNAGRKTDVYRWQPTDTAVIKILTYVKSFFASQLLIWDDELTNWWIVFKQWIRTVHFILLRGKIRSLERNKSNLFPSFYAVNSSYII